VLYQEIAKDHIIHTIHPIIIFTTEDHITIDLL
jgi:hypothetical protein